MNYLIFLICAATVPTLSLSRGVRITALPVNNVSSLHALSSDVLAYGMFLCSLAGFIEVGVAPFMFTGCKCSYVGSDVGGI